MSFIKLMNLSKKLGQDTVLHDTTIEIEKGEFVTLLGPSGCGKTTLLRLIAGFLQPDTGRIVVDGQEVTSLPANKRDMGMVFQSYALFPNMTVAENIMFGLKMRKVNVQEQHDRMDQMLSFVGLTGKENFYPRELSGGQQQRVALARALVTEPKVLLLDEPLSALDAKIRISLRGLIRDLQKRLGITTIFVTHDQEEALSMSDRIFVMQKGKFVQAGTPQELYNQPSEEFVAQFIGTYNFLPVIKMDRDKGHIQTQLPLTLPKFHQVLTDKHKIAVRPEAIQISPEPLPSLETENVFAAQIRNIAFLGSLIRITVEIDKIAMVVDVLNSPERTWFEGQHVYLRIPSEACIVVAS